ncbi:uncharacterized protein ARB_06235 [Trichophyton benhamiae CBS 112371]|uniref:Uncharacterized protein n=1 Tax=Arthroderma benhamiae (strain ATCC MYA-4681 / CBS 112371) TaxID=663331 RepID=D4APR7_ARTBC|nr:uncharacterized protein ARB_06235 [Trichophyton benhamiae CBS 112371]EFE35278.1 hypothetical protein ARB_06235 [Trichophyton benhamiae CBS 112371]
MAIGGDWRRDDPGATARELVVWQRESVLEKQERQTGPGSDVQEQAKGEQKTRGRGAWRMEDVDPADGQLEKKESRTN